MKKITALILMMVICLSLSSCELLEQFLSDSKKDPEEVKDTTVTEEEWNAALNIINYTLNGENRSVTKEVTNKAELGSIEAIENGTLLCEQNETAQHTKEEHTSKRMFDGKTEEDSYSAERYEVYDADADTWYSLFKNKETGEWTGTPHGYSENKELNRRLYVDSVENTIDNFTYDEEKKAYVRDIKIPGGAQVEITSAKLYFYFEDNNLVKVVTIVEAEDSGTSDYNGETVSYTTTITKTNTLLISNHGTTTVTVPEYTV